MNFRIVTSAEKLATVAEAWKSDYCHDGTWDIQSARQKISPQQVYKHLLSAKSIDEVEAILGRKQSRTRYFCDACHKWTRVAASILTGDDADDTYICRHCLVAMAGALNALQSEVLTSVEAGEK